MTFILSLRQLLKISNRVSCTIKCVDLRISITLHLKQSETIMFVAASIAILIAMFLAIVRAVLGPTIYDRILAINTFGTKALLLIADTLLSAAQRDPTAWARRRRLRSDSRTQALSKQSVHRSDTTKYLKIQHRPYSLGALSTVLPVLRCHAPCSTVSISHSSIGSSSSGRFSLSSAGNFVALLVAAALG